VPIIFHALAEMAAAASQGVISYPPAFFAEARPANAQEMIARLPGFTFDDGADVRGYEGAAGNVLIDGQRPASKSDDLYDILRRIPAGQVARIDVIRGGAPGIDMQGKSVLANVVRARSGGVHGLVAVSDEASLDDGRQKFYGRLEASGGAEGRAWEVALKAGNAADWASADGPHTRIFADGSPPIRGKVQSQANGMPGAAAASYELPLFGGRLKVNGRLASDRYDYDETSRDAAPAPRLERTHDADDTDETEIGANFGRDFGGRLKLDLVALRRSKDETFAEAYRPPGSHQDFSQASGTVETIGRVVVKFVQRPILSWEAGGETAINSLDNQVRFSQDGVAIALPAANVRVEEKRWELFAKAVWRPAPAWTVEASLRQEGSTISSSGDVALEKSLSFTKPRLAIAWAPDAATQLRVSVERTVGQLDFNDFTATSSLSTGVLTAGNPNLSPEQAWVTEATVERRFWGAGAGVLTLRHSALTDAIDRAPVVGPGGVFDAPANIGAGTKDELVATLTLPLDRLGLKGAQLRGTSTWRRSEVTDPATHDRRDISKLHPLDWELHFNWDIPKWRASAGVDLYGPFQFATYRFDQIDLLKRPAYVQLFYEWKPSPDLSWRVELNNLAGRGLRTTNYVHSGPRGANGLAFVDDRDTGGDRVLKLRLRKTFR
jgi:outer membrane receptor protein involved in Fe transport